MALMDNEQYYYFKMRLGKPYEIKVTAVHINLLINLLYQEMTTEQREFYLEHPDATVMEVWNCELVPPYVPPTPDVSEYAAEKNKGLKEACLATVSVSTIEYAMANACLAGTALVYSGAQHYTTVQARALMKTFMDESDHAMTVYETYSPQISEASTIEAIDALYEQAIAAL